MNALDASDEDVNQEVRELLEKIRDHRSYLKEERQIEDNQLLDLAQEVIAFNKEESEAQEAPAPESEPAPPAQNHKKNRKTGGKRKKK